MFIGREQELQRLEALREKKAASFVVIKGRRRIGKSRLIEEFGGSFNSFYRFVGLAPDKDIDETEQLNEFARQMAQQFRIAPARYSDWSDAFWALADAIGNAPKKKRVLLLFDEISWMGSESPTFLAKIKNLWDQHLKRNTQLIFVVCGSASSWIDQHIIKSTGFMGRISLTLSLEPLPLNHCRRFWPKRIDAYEILKVLAVTGGIPRYLEEIDPNESAETNIKNLCFSSGGVLVEEFEHIMADLFLRKSPYYKKILCALVSKSLSVSEIQLELGLERPGRLPEYLYELEVAGFVTRDYAWNIRTGEDSKLSQFRLRDNYFRFYLKYIEKNLSKIRRNSFSYQSLSALPGWASIVGLQVENIVLSDRHLIHRTLNIEPQDIRCENPYFQRKTSRHEGCQIDYMIQTRFNCLYVCEIKFSKRPIGMSVIDEVERKIKALATPRGYSFRPVLIHVNGVSEDLEDSGYFSKIIDMGVLVNQAYRG